jgi:hypothetical protein
MKLLSFDYIFERILLRYGEVNFSNVIKLLMRGKKMYETID